MKINEKRPGLAHVLKKKLLFVIHLTNDFEFADEIRTRNPLPKRATETYHRTGTVATFFLYNYLTLFLCHFQASAEFWKMRGLVGSRKDNEV